MFSIIFNDLIMFSINFIPWVSWVELDSRATRLPFGLVFIGQVWKPNPLLKDFHFSQRWRNSQFERI